MSLQIKASNNKNESYMLYLLAVENEANQSCYPFGWLIGCFDFDSVDFAPNGLSGYLAADSVILNWCREVTREDSVLGRDHSKDQPVQVGLASFVLDPAITATEWPL